MNRSHRMHVGYAWMYLLTPNGPLTITKKKTKELNSRATWILWGVECRRHSQWRLHRKSRTQKNSQIRIYRYIALPLSAKWISNVAVMQHAGESGTIHVYMQPARVRGIRIKVLGPIDLIQMAFFTFRFVCENICRISGQQACGRSHLLFVMFRD